MGGRIMKMRGDVAYINIGGLLIRFDFDRSPDDATAPDFQNAHGGHVTTWTAWGGLLWHAPTRSVKGGRPHFHQPAPERHRCTHPVVPRALPGLKSAPYSIGECPCGGSTIIKRRPQ